MHWNGRQTLLSSNERAWCSTTSTASNTSLRKVPATSTGFQILLFPCIYYQFLVIAPAVPHTRVLSRFGCVQIISCSSGSGKGFRATCMAWKQTEAACMASARWLIRMFLRLPCGRGPSGRHHPGGCPNKIVRTKFYSCVRAEFTPSGVK